MIVICDHFSGCCIKDITSITDAERKQFQTKCSKVFDYMY